MKRRNFIKTLTGIGALLLAPSLAFGKQHDYSTDIKIYIGNIMRLYKHGGGTPLALKETVEYYLANHPEVKHYGVDCSDVKELNVVYTHEVVGLDRIQHIVYKHAA